MSWPALLKPEQGGSGARIQVADSLAHVIALFDNNPGIWLPDNLFLLQELLPHDPERGHRAAGVPRRRAAVRDARGDARALQPVPVADLQPGRWRGHLRDSSAEATVPPEFYPFPEVPAEAVETALRIVRAAKLDVGGIEYLETPTDGASSTTSTRTRTCGRR